MQYPSAFFLDDNERSSHSQLAAMEIKHRSERYQGNCNLLTETRNILR